MDTTKTNEPLNENAKEAGKIFNDNDTAIMDMYGKQLDLITGFYTNFFNTMMGGNKGWKQDKGFMDLFRDNNNFTKLFSNSFCGVGNGFQNPFASSMQNDFTRLFSNPFNRLSNGFQNPFLTSFEKIFSQMGDYNHNLFSAFTGETRNNTDWSEISKKYKETIDSRLEISKNMLKSATEAYNKQLESSIEANKKMVEDINNQFSSVVKQTQKFWADILNINKSRLTEENLNIKEPTPGEPKKRSNVPVTEFMDHKG
jgi:hypothetical protein